MDFNTLAKLRRLKDIDSGGEYDAQGLGLGLEIRRVKFGVTHL